MGRLIGLFHHGAGTLHLNPACILKSCLVQWSMNMCQLGTCEKVSGSPTCEVSIHLLSSVVYNTQIYQVWYGNAVNTKADTSALTWGRLPHKNQLQVQLNFLICSQAPRNFTDIRFITQSDAEHPPR